jgi:acyl-CoA dehydrogenase
MDEVLTSSFETLLAKLCDSARTRRIEAGETADELWGQLEDSGYVDALVPTEQGGAGLSLRDITDLTIASGRHVLPLPLAQTMYARAELARAGLSAPRGAITFADRVRIDKDAITAECTAFAMTAAWVRLSFDGREWLLPVNPARRSISGGHGSLDADLHWHSLPEEAILLDRVDKRLDLRATGAAFTAALLAGAMEGAVQMSIAYANERVQFGKPIGKQQAIQHQLSVMCELMYAARTAASLGLCSENHVDRLRAAAAKSRTSEAALTIANLSHAVHGAIGITAEYDLQMYTRRLHEFRQAYGSETYWNRVLGTAMLGSSATPLEFVRNHLHGGAIQQA